MDLNISLIKKIFSLIDIEIVIKNTKEIYEFRELLDAKKKSVYKTPIYNQVFNSKHGYINNLSILDLIFNLGPDSNFYLKKIQL